MSTKRRRQKLKRPVRALVLETVASNLWPMTGHEIAAVLCMPYKTVVDALTALNNQGKVWRLGRKFTAQWTCTPPAAQNARALRHLDHLFKP